MSGGHKAGNMEAELCGVTISVMICGELMVVGVLGGGTTEGLLALRLGATRDDEVDISYI